jgi:hypothetical protein
VIHLHFSLLLPASCLWKGSMESLLGHASRWIDDGEKLACSDC